MKILGIHDGHNASACLTIDGNLKVAIDCISRKYSANSYDITSGQRLFQVCMGDLTPFRVKIVEKLDDTSRGSGGHGSTGK